jgi:hypothetical protein
MGLVCAALLCACSSAGGTPPPSGTNAGSFPETAYAIAMGDAMHVKVEMRTAPQPPVAGVNEALIALTDTQTGAPVDGADIAVVPWMPAMGHGTSIVPTVTPQGDGKYLVTNLSFFMPGTWELRTTFSGAVTDHAVVSFQVP